MKQSQTQHIRLSDPYVVLDYGDAYIDRQDALTCALACDLLVDLKIYVCQVTHNSLVFESEHDRTLALLYMTKYTSFKVSAVG